MFMLKNSYNKMNWTIFIIENEPWIVCIFSLKMSPELSVFSVKMSPELCFLYPRPTKLEGGVYWIHLVRPSVRLSVCL